VVRAAAAAPAALAATRPTDAPVGLRPRAGLTAEQAAVQDAASAVGEAGTAAAVAAAATRGA